MTLSTWAPVPLRLIVGIGIMEHGCAKLLKGPEAFAAILHALNVLLPHLIAWLTILTELLGGFAVLLGACIPLVSAPMAVVLLTVILVCSYFRVSVRSRSKGSPRESTHLTCLTQSLVSCSLGLCAVLRAIEASCH
jgi:uncharacterized membrane protein YphA (DoxX/SURF4 family)